MKLQAKLLLGIVPAIVVGVLGLAWVVFTELRASSGNELLRQMELVFTQTERRTDSFLATATANARLFADSVLVERYIRVEDEEARFELMQPTILDLFASYRAAYPGYVEIQLLLPDGYEDTRLAQPGRPNLTDEESTSAFFEAMEAAGDSTYTAFLIDPDDDEPAFKIGQPILLENLGLDPNLAERELYGYLVVTASSDFLAREVIGERIGRSGYFFLIDGEGRIVAHPDPALVGSRADRHEALLATAASATSTIEPLGAAPATSGDDPLTLSSRPLHDNLLIVGALPKRELQAASGELARSVAGITAVTILLAVSFFWLLLRELVLLPLADLRRTVIAIGDGDFDVASGHAAPRDDEIGDLELAFRDMNVKLSRSMSDLMGSYTRIHELAHEDSLTRLANRRQFLSTLATAVEARKEGRGKLAVLYLDLDEFKKVNDLLGHDAGDELLLEVSCRLRKCLRPPGATAAPPRPVARPCIARLGGDEFIVLLPDIDGAADAVSAGERVLGTLTAPIELRGQRFVIGSSVGIALYPDHASDADGLVKCADTAMYAVKNEAKNGLRLYGQEMQRQVETQVRLESDLRLALDRGELRLAYQPQVCTRSGATSGVEALLRWEHPERGFVSPAEFIPVAERTGLIEPIGAWVVEEACRQWSVWSGSGLEPGRIAVNVSPRQFALQAVADVVAAALERHGVPPRALEIEITESCMMEAPTSVIDALGQLRERGVRVAMDDFGTGHSSLAMLASLPIDTLKIDRSFVTAVQDDTVRGRIVTTVISLANELGLETLAEGIETEEELAFLTARHCDVVQGYLLSRPLSADDATFWLAARGPRFLKAS